MPKMREDASSIPWIDEDNNDVVVGPKKIDNEQHDL
jgi:hypothetical protein